MARMKAKAPARRYHISGQSVVTIAGRDFYMGPHDSPESIEGCAALIRTETNEHAAKGYSRGVRRSVNFETAAD